MLATGIPVTTWLDQGDSVLATVLDIAEQRAAEARAAQRKRRKGA
jgi:hypothetical protein